MDPVLPADGESVGLSHLGETGVDEQASVVLEHEGGRLANLSIGIRTATPQEATIMGTEGYARIQSGETSDVARLMDAPDVEM